VDFRLVAATNINLEKAVAAGTFRRDLYYRLSVMSFHVPLLRERPADILPLAEHFLGLYSRRLAVPTPRLAASTGQALLRYAWPGNIRELENIMHAAVLTAEHALIKPEDLRFSSLPGSAPEAGNGDPWHDITRALDRLFDTGVRGIHEKLEELAVRRAFEQANGNQVRTASLLDVSRNVVRTLLKRAGLLDRAK
jgi:sigma-54-specific transcriptional regulator